MSVILSSVMFLVAANWVVAETETNKQDLLNSDINQENMLSTLSICNLPKEHGISSSTQTLLVDKHNEYRKNEPAANMMKLTWDDELARQAKYWVDQCIYDHGALKFCNDSFVGQNGGYTKANLDNPRSGPGTAADFIRLWFGEKSHFNISTGACKAGKLCGHYKLVTWARTRKVGCAWKRCQSAKKVEPRIKAVSLFFCNYYPHGNYAPKPYIVGDACTRCETVLNNKITPAYRCIDDAFCEGCTSLDEHSDCRCLHLCQNGGTQNSTCHCECPDNYCGEFCQNENVNKHKDYYCNYWARQGFCKKSNTYYSYMKGWCVKACGFCDS